MFKKIILGSSLVFSMLSPFHSAWAAAIVNGSFDSDLSGWESVPTNGNAVWDSGAAVLATGSGVSAYSSVLVQGDDGFFNFPSPLLLETGNDFLSFDAVFSSLGSDSAESGLGTGDNLQLWMYDANDINGNYPLAVIDASTSQTGFSIDLTAYIGLSVAFSFELNDEDDGLNSQVVLDNVRLESRAAPVPEPTVLWLMLIGLFGFLVSSSRELKKNVDREVLSFKIFPK